MNVARKIACVLVLPLLLGVVACDDLLVVNPTESVPPDVATGNANAVQALLTGVYERLQLQSMYNSNLLIYPEVMADNAQLSTPPQNLQGPFLNQFGSHMGGWGVRYQAINEANFVIASAPDLTDTGEATRNRLRGEALFLRALNYFDLARIYAYEPPQIVGGWDVGVVLRTEPTRTIQAAEPRPRSSVHETYERIEADLLESISLLSGSTGDNVYFATLAASHGLLARVYLYWGRWQDAIPQATAAMETTSARLATPAEYATIFASQPNVESVFEIWFTQFNQNYVNYCMACYVHPGGTWFSIWPSEELLETFEEGDARLSVFPRTADGIPFVNKWSQSAGDYMDNVPVIRYAELLLTRAEAYAETGQATLAQADLETLRAARGLSGPVTATGPELIDLVLAERRRELAFEGHRWFDLKRRGMDIPKPAVSGMGALSYEDNRILAPLPNNEVQNNDLLVQNPGY